MRNIKNEHGRGWMTALMAAALLAAGGLGAARADAPSAAASSLPEFSLKRCATPPVIDGDLADSVWAEAVALPLNLWRKTGAGPASATFDIAAVDDAVVDGTQTVTITASAASHADGTATVDVTDNEATFVAANLFYNNSLWDWNTVGDIADPGASIYDDNAIATDKVALLAADGAATFANYSSYDKGINGIIIDINNISGTPDATDFTFKVGNDSTPAGWIAAAVPTSITVRAGAGQGGSDRLTIIWTDGAISNTWLEVTVKAGGNIGLITDYTFYFGNAIGESGNFTTDAMVNASDQLRARNNNTAPGAAAVDNSYDYNRDQSVEAGDILKARSNPTSPTNMLKLINP